MSIGTSTSGARALSGRSNANGANGARGADRGLSTRRRSVGSPGLPHGTVLPRPYRLHAGTGLAPAEGGGGRRGSAQQGQGAWARRGRERGPVHAAALRRVTHRGVE